MRSAWALVAVAAGCRFDLPAAVCETSAQCNAGPGGRCEPNGFCSYADPSCTPSGQRYGENAGNNSGQCVGGGGDIDAPPSLVCYGDTNGLVKPCFPTAPTGTLILPGTMDTGASPICSTTVTGADGFCVIAAETIQVEATVRAIGTRPLVLVATRTIDVGGTLDAASHHSPTAPFMTTQVGAGSEPAGECNAGTPPTAGGGAGGTLIALGGIGGTSAGTGGTPGLAQTVTTLRGGCRGQNGTGGNPGAGGHGGGALYLIAEQMINIMAPINASGEGGRGGQGMNGSGGGGGSGGMIGLDSPMISNSSVVFANGASGGEGSGDATTGAPGSEPNSATPTPPAGGGSASGGDGGGGGGGGTGGGGPTGGNGINGAGGGGGGGGGGGAGVIKVFRGTLGGQHSPVPS